VPSELITAKVDVRATATLVEVWRNRVRLTSHPRSYGPKGTAVTKPEHRPHAHRQWGDWPPERLVSWAETKGPQTAEVAAAILGRGPHPESGRRACLGLLRMGEEYGSARLEAACGRALAIHSPTYKSVKTILKTGLDKVALTEAREGHAVVHENIRGGDYFDREEGKETSSDSDACEAHYLAEERLAIIDEPSTEASRTAPRPGLAGPAGKALEAAPSSAPKAISTLIERLQTLWTRPAATKHGTAVRGSEDSQLNQEKGPDCTSSDTCLPTPGNNEEPLSIEREERMRNLQDAMTCDVEEGGHVSSWPRRGEVE